MNKFQISSKLSKLLILLVIVTNVGCDQISKSLVRENVAEKEMIEIIGNHFILTNVENEGAFLGAGSSFEETYRILLLCVLPMLILMALFYYIMREKKLSSIMAISMACIIGGGIGNIYDRVVYGSVTDFFHIDLGLLKTGIFNLADVSIMVGMFSIVFINLFMNQAKNKLDN